MIPLPADIHWTSPWPMMPLFPMLSSCSTRPSNMYVTVSIPRCGCHGNPATYSAGFSERKSSRSRNGSNRETSAAPQARPLMAGALRTPRTHTTRYAGQNWFAWSRGAPHLRQGAIAAMDSIKASNDLTVLAGKLPNPRAVHRKAQSQKPRSSQESISDGPISVEGGAQGPAGRLGPFRYLRVQGQEKGRPRRTRGPSTEAGPTPRDAVRGARTQGPDRPTGNGHLRKGWDDSASLRRGESAGGPRRTVSGTDTRGTRSRLPVARAQTGPWQGGARDLQPESLRGSPRGARSQARPAGRVAPPLPRNQRLRTALIRGRHHDSEIFPPHRCGRTKDASAGSAP